MVLSTPQCLKDYFPTFSGFVSLFQPRNHILKFLARWKESILSSPLFSCQDCCRPFQVKTALYYCLASWNKLKSFNFFSSLVLRQLKRKLTTPLSLLLTSVKKQEFWLSGRRSPGNRSFESHSCLRRHWTILIILNIPLLVSWTVKPLDLSADPSSRANFPHLTVFTAG